MKILFITLTLLFFSCSKKAPEIPTSDLTALISDRTTSKIEINQVLKAKVESFNSFGINVSTMEGEKGFIHADDISWTRTVVRPDTLHRVGEELTVKVLGKDEEKLLFGLKQVSEDPWLSIDNYILVDKVVEGEVVDYTSYAAFLKLEKGIIGMVHITQLSKNKVYKVLDAVNIGEKVKARVMKIDKEKRMIALTIKDVEL